MSSTELRSPRARAVRLAAATGTDPRRVSIAGTLAGRFWLRWHLTLMLAVAMGTGFIVSHALLHTPIHSILVRWLCGLAAGYAALFAVMRLWLAYVGVRPLAVDAGSLLDGQGPVLPGNGIGMGAGRAAAGGPFAGGGGSSGGAGASASFDGPNVGSAARMLAVGQGSGGSSGGLDLGDAVSGDDGWMVVVLGAVVVALVLGLGGSVAYMVYEAPHLLADVAFGSALTSGLAGATRRAARLDWCESVLGATWKPFAAMAGVAVVAAVVLGHYFPGAETLGQAWLIARAH